MSIHPPDVADPSPLLWDEFRRQETTLIALNLVVLASVVIVHGVFWSILGSPTLASAIALGLRFVEQSGEFVWLQRRQDPLSPGVVLWYPRLSIWINVAFAFLMGVLGHGHDPHYAILMVLPMIAAGFRAALPGLAAIVLTGSGLALLQVWIHAAAIGDEYWSETFEAATMGIVYLVVAIVVRVLSRQLESDRTRLRDSLFELQRTRDRLVVEEKLAAVGRLAAAVAHEIRNPVACISSSIVLAEASADPERHREAYAIVAEEAGRLERLTTDLLTYANTRPLEPTPVPVQTLVSYLAGLARAKAEQAGLTLAFDAAGDVSVMLDSFQIQQALLNLVLNAIDATPSGGRVAIRTKVGPRRDVVFSVENTAGPIDPSSVGRLFEPFFTTKARGTGLGLAIARSIARAHGGDVTLVRNDPGVVCFDLTLPDAQLTQIPGRA